MIVRLLPPSRPSIVVRITGVITRVDQKWKMYTRDSSPFPEDSSEYLTIAELARRLFFPSLRIRLPPPFDQWPNFPERIFVGFVPVAFTVVRYCRDCFVTMSMACLHLALCIARLTSRSRGDSSWTPRPRVRWADAVSDTGSASTAPPTACPGPEAATSSRPTAGLVFTSRSIDARTERICDCSAPTPSKSWRCTVHCRSASSARSCLDWATRARSASGTAPRGDVTIEVTHAGLAKRALAAGNDNGQC